MFKRYHSLCNSSVLSSFKPVGRFYSRFVVETDYARKFGKIAVSTVVAVSLTACGHSGQKSIARTDMGNRLTGYVGSISSDEPQAAMVARDVLVRGGNAADAAAALGFALTVTLPSRASLGGGGACISYRSGQPAQSFLFLPRPGSAQGADDRPAAIPMMARGLYLLQASDGKSDINDILHLVGNLAQNGITVSDSFANDLAAVHGALFTDPSMQKLFTRNDGTPLQAGDMLYQPRLKIIYDRLITAGIADLYIGSLAHSYALGARTFGGGLNTEDFRNALPVQTPALSVVENKRVTYFLSPPADGGLGMAMAWLAVSNGQGDSAAISQGSVAKWRAENAVSYDKQGALAASKQAQSWVEQGNNGSGSLPSLPASTSFSVVDREGNAVSCALTMNNLFGTGRIAGTTGIVMAASPKQFPRPLLTAAISTYRNHFIAGVAASGQNGAAGAGAEVLSSLLNHPKIHKKQAITVAHPGNPEGRVNAVYCADGMPGDTDQCHAYTDPQGTGLGISQ